MAKEDVHNKFKEIGDRIEEVATQENILEHYLNLQYYQTVEKHGLHHKQHEFNQKQKDELVDNIMGSLTEHYFKFRKVPKEVQEFLKKSGELEETILPAYFGVSRSSLRDLWKDKKRITRKDVNDIVKSVYDTFSKHRYHAELARITPDDLEEGKKYLAKVNKEHSLEMDLDKIKTYKGLNNAFLNAHLGAYQTKLHKKFKEEKYEPE